MLDTLQVNLLSPMALAFALGIVATLVKSDLRFPEGMASALSIYLLLAIGLKGGAQLAQANLGELIWPALAAIMLGGATPIWCFLILRRLGKLGIADAAAIAAHYGSVSAVTFSASLTLLEAVGQNYEGYVAALVALMEVPGIAVALLIARAQMGGDGSIRDAMHEVLTGKGIILLLGGLVVGWLGGKAGYEQVAPFFADPFKGALTLFLLDLGMVAARQLGQLRKVGLFLVGFGILMPLLHGIVGVWIGGLAGLSVGGAMVFGVLAASASYIAAPAAVRVALPQANPGYYLTAALAITFPFNLAIGMPIYYAIAQALG
jgi:hypothetical protein